MTNRSLLAFNVVALSDISSAVDIVEWNNDFSELVVLGQIVSFEDQDLGLAVAVDSEGQNVLPDWSLVLIVSYLGLESGCSDSNLAEWVHLAHKFGADGQSGGLWLDDEGS